MAAAIRADTHLSRCSVEETSKKAEIWNVFESIVVIRYEENDNCR